SVTGIGVKGSILRLRLIKILLGAVEGLFPSIEGQAGAGAEAVSSKCLGVIAAVFPDVCIVQLADVGSSAAEVVFANNEPRNDGATKSAVVIEIGSQPSLLIEVRRHIRVTSSMVRLRRSTTKC